MRKELISIIIPVFNEEANIAFAMRAIESAIRPLSQKYEFEFVFTDNHSSDGSFEILKRLAQSDSRVRVFRLSKNFGYQKSIWTGYCKARGACAIQIDCDLQDPPEIFGSFISHWENGSKVVYGIRQSRGSESRWLTFCRKIFYRTVNYVCDFGHIPLDAGDFRLVDRCIIDQIIQSKDQNPYLRGLIATMGFDQKGVSYRRNDRRAGSSKFGARQLFSLALDALLNSTNLALRASIYVGISTGIISIFGSLLVVIGHFEYGQNWPTGFATLSVLILAGISLNSFFLGVIGFYISRLYTVSINRPITIIEQSVDHSNESNREA